VALQPSSVVRLRQLAKNSSQIHNPWSVINRSGN
jgi:hypothetical protein